MGLYEFHLNKDISVYKGCGLGGTSLVNAGVSLIPEPRVLEQANWPAEPEKTPIRIGGMWNGPGICCSLLNIPKG